MPENSSSLFCSLFRKRAMLLFSFPALDHDAPVFPFPL